MDGRQGKTGAVLCEGAFAWHRRSSGGVSGALVLFICSAFLAAVFAGPKGGAGAGNLPWYLFSTFRGNGEDGLHLAISRDGLRWTALNDDRPFLRPEIGRKEKLMRDPCIVQGRDGTFHMVWTTGWREKIIGYSSSRDLIVWAPQQAIPVMEHEEAAQNAWAPELFFDDDRGEWLIFWATTIPGRFPGTDESGNGGLNHRIYFTATRDFRSFARPALFYDPGFNVIDSTIFKSGSGYVMVLKDERKNPLMKNLRLAFAAKAAGPYGPASEAFTGAWVEGPTVLRVGREWIVYFDRYRDHLYGAAKSADLKNWEDISDRVSFPKGFRHGTALRIGRSVADKLLKAGK